MRIPLFLPVLVLLLTALPARAADLYDVTRYGATGRKDDDAQPAIQRAIDACAAAGGGTVHFPPGAYTSATLQLRSYVTLHLAAGATLYASRQEDAYPLRKESGYRETGVPVLLYGRDLTRIAITGKGTVDGQAEHAWNPLADVDGFIAAETELARRAGVEMKRAYVVGPRVSLLYLVGCTDVHLENVSFVRSPHWTLHLAHCERVFLRGLSIFTDPKSGVNADGIDIDGCRNVMVSDCRVATGDDAICLKSTNRDGQYTDCEDITITNCTLSSTSAGLKIGTETFGNFRRIVFSNCVITDSNRGIGIFVRDGGTVEDVLFSNLVIDCRRKHFNWWGDGDALRLVVLQRTPESKVGTIRSVLIQNVVGRVQGTSRLEGHAESPLQHITLSNVQLRMEPESQPDKRATDALYVTKAENVTFKDLRIDWAAEGAEPRWRSALRAEAVTGLQVDGLTARPGLAGSDAPAVDLTDCRAVTLRNSTAAAGTGTFLAVAGRASAGIRLLANDLSRSRRPLARAKEVHRKSISLRK
ncbi:MAG: GH28 [uncultured Cytophagales bacterium]|uniref:GH28 n=1 Tax=uncultured Cytophagales bacterium TaxID=158755 RepID=A0A6J4JIK4_9SPHI|nr:MAG: GH28 [uncultured Cytophagales bacterium]